MLGVDFNGVHALSGLLLFGPAFYFALRPRWALLYAAYVSVALIVTGIWAALSTSPAGVFAFPNNDADAILHISMGVLFGIVAAIQLAQDRSTPSFEPQARLYHAGRWREAKRNQNLPNSRDIGDFDRAADCAGATGRCR